MKAYSEITRLFEQANREFLAGEVSLFDGKVSERTFCGALMLHIANLIRTDPSYDGYYVDVEYNRNKGGLKTICKTIRGQDFRIVGINCDLILHSRGEKPEQDNLLAIEMKKSYRSPGEKESDRERLIALTKASYDDIWSADGRSLPEHVCGYVLGVYYEIDFPHKTILIEYYRNGNKESETTCPFPTRCADSD